MNEGKTNARNGKPPARQKSAEESISMCFACTLPLIDSTTTTVQGTRNRQASGNSRERVRLAAQHFSCSALRRTVQVTAPVKVRRQGRGRPSTTYLYCHLSRWSLVATQIFWPVSVIPVHLGHLDLRGELLRTSDGGNHLCTRSLRRLDMGVRSICGESSLAADRTTSFLALFLFSFFSAEAFCACRGRAHALQ
jgi:hypothetical protein